MPPESIPSPYTVLGTWKAGDSFDFSIALCSLLIGVGYDAHVCMDRIYQRRLQRMIRHGTCPLLEREAAAAAAAAEDAEDSTKKKCSSKQHKIKEPTDLTCKIDEMLLAEEVAKMTPPESKESEAPEKSLTQRPNLATAEDKYNGRGCMRGC